jgi:hypothetical protein
MRGAVCLHPARVTLAYSRLFVPSRRAKASMRAEPSPPMRLLPFAAPHTDPSRQHISGCLCAEALSLEVLLGSWQTIGTYPLFAYSWCSLEPRPINVGPQNTGSA